MKGCIEEGELQAYADGELPADAAARVAAHLAACAACDAAAREAAAEFAAFASAFSAEESLSVPTERLRARIAAAVAEADVARGATPAVSTTGGSPITARWRSFAAALAASLAPRRAAAFAGLALAALLAGAIFYALRQQPDAPGGQKQNQELAAVEPTPARSASPQGGQGGGAAGVAPQASGSPGASPTREDLAANPNSQKKGARGDLAKNPVRVGPPKLDTKRGAPPKESLLPVEREYAAEIASLKSAIERQAQGGLSPTLRTEYARGLAAVDQAIAASRGVAKTNPSDPEAQEFLRMAYRDKLDLLSAVADRAQPAGLER